MSPMSGLRHQLKMLGTALLGKRATKSVKKKPFTEVELKDLRTAFDLLDRNRDGRVTANELQFMLKNLGINVRDELIDDLIKEASHTGNGLIDETEFLQWVGRIQALRDETEESTSKTDELDDVTEDLIAAFRVFDRDGNGFITRDELQTAMEMIGESLTETQLSQLLAIADLDKDGKINYEGAISIWTKCLLYCNMEDIDTSVVEIILKASILKDAQTMHQFTRLLL